MPKLECKFLRYVQLIANVLAAPLFERLFLLLNLEGIFLLLNSFGLTHSVHIVLLDNVVHVLHLDNPANSGGHSGRVPNQKFIPLL